MIQMVQIVEKVRQEPEKLRKPIKLEELKYCSQEEDKRTHINTYHIY